MAARADGVDGVPPDPAPTVLRGSSSSARRRPGPPALPAAIAMPQAGDLIEMFRLEEAIGAGGMGAVFRALDTKLDRQVALKLLPPDQAADAEVVQRFYQEGRAAARLDHENIARVFSIGREGPFHYIAFEYIEGVTIRQRVEAFGPLKVAEAVDIALQIAHALVHASERGVVHRDIKPSNIIITPQGRAKLVDMGLARRFERGGDHGLTQSGMTLGTFDYISPEQARDPRDVDVRSDLYSLGCTLFHMLTGRPPFPGGTVLQKLIQHQEEAPADVRSLNPEVPAELAAVIAKLMAKDRDRRYQGPEQLVRDLLGVAGVIGLGRTPSEFEARIVHGHRPTWERHLVWLLPALGFIVVISGLVWWGREFSKPSSPAARPGGAAASTRHPQDWDPTGGSAAAESQPASVSGRQDPDPPSPPPAYPRTIPVSSSEDLLAILATAPRRSSIVLTDEGPYRLGGRARSPRTPAPLAHPDLTIRAEAGVRPRLRFAQEARPPDQPLSALLHFVGGHVTIEGLEFELDGAPAEEPVAAVRIEGTELTLRGCSFRRPASGPHDGRGAAAIRLRSDPARGPGGDRPPALVADSCHFDGGQVAVQAEGPADVLLRDCTMGPAQPSIRFENPRTAPPVPCELRLLHASILAGPGPVFHFEGSLVRAWVDDSVIAPAGRSPTTLVRIDEPHHLSWRGRSNLYAQIGAYLVSTAQGGQPATIADFASWEQTPTEVRETGSRVAATPVWEAADPWQSLARERENPTRAFLLNSSLAATSDLGARRGPFGSTLKDDRPANRSGGEPIAPAAPRGTGEAVASRPSRGVGAATVPAPSPVAADLAGTPAPAGGVPPPAASSDPMDLSSMPPMVPAATVSSSESETPANPEAPAPPAAESPARAEPAKIAAEPSPTPAPRPVAGGFSDEDAIRSTEQFLAMLKRLGRRGGSLRIAAGADLELPTILIEGMGRVQLLAEPGPRRPRLRFRPPEVSPASPTDWAVMLHVKSGSLQVQGLDIVIPDPETLRADRVAAVGLLSGAELSLTDCTLTVVGRRPAASVFVAQPRGEASRAGPAEPAASRGTVLKLDHCFLRSGGAGVTLAGRMRADEDAGRQLTLELADVLVATEGSLLHAVGGIRPAPLEPPAVMVRLDRVTARVKGGLVHLDSTPDEPELTSVEIRAEGSILSTAAGDHPLFRLEGQDQLDQLRDKIRWEGRNVAYHRIKTYRRDEIVQTGASPRIYDRNDWTNAFLPKDESPVLGDVQFVREADPAPPAWELRRDDLRVVPGSPAAHLGPDVDRVPPPPADDDL